ncbi:membrane protein containing Mechanosensitive ion channel MscS [Candidatus Magnetomorum sp. HK-1]|nr:membrane protein containing Mechanosensitive ion channel MscS [Candidatus Magnetomorum sp. HK-1]
MKIITKKPEKKRNKVKHITIITIIFIIIILLLILFIKRDLLFNNENYLYIAAVGPMTGEDKSHGREMVKGINFYINQINKKGGINGRKFQLIVFDDKNDIYLARKKALEIAECKKNILAVIGHYKSDTSFQGGLVYRITEIPAITASATNDRVTFWNDWYYRVIFNNSSQGVFLANYIKKVFNEDIVHVIYDQDVYGATLARAFKSSFLKLGGKEFSWSFDKRDKNIDNIIKQIADEVIAKQKEHKGLIFISTHQKEAVELIVALKRKKNKATIIGSDALGENIFADRFNKYPEEKITPGYFSQGIYATSPIIFDVADEKAQQFRNEFVKKYNKESGWTAATYYEATYVAIQAIKNANIEGQPNTIIQDRKKIKQALSMLDSEDNSIDSITGNVYFDTDGNVVKPLVIGYFHNKNFISAMTQLKPVNLSERMYYIENDIKEKHLLQVNDQYMYKTNVVYTGAELNEISEIDKKNYEYTLDFTLWFRYIGEFDPKKIEFLNSVKPIELNTPSYEEKNDLFSYCLFNVKGRFKADFLTIRPLFGQHILGFSFCHKDMLLNNLVFVTDIAGMGLNLGNSLINKLRKKQIIKPVYGLTIVDGWLFQNIEKKLAQGKPKFINQQKDVVQYSRFNYGVLIKSDSFSFRRLISDTIAWYVFTVCFYLLIFLLFVGKLINKPLKILLFIRIILICLILLSLEVYILDFFGNKLIQNSLGNIVKFFDILWWYIPAIILCRSIEKFIWIPIERKTNHQIPQLVRRIVSFIIYTLAYFGIVAYTFDQKLTGLLATSGLIAMIIGMAIQINISNIFSGIALNLEQPFRVGDWVKIGQYSEGIVVDVNWRATRIKTGQNYICSIPNSMVAETIVHNYHYPDDIYSLPTHVYVDSIHSPDRIQKILYDSAIAADGVLDEPELVVRFKGVTQWAADYLINPSYRDYGKRFFYSEALWKSIWKNLELAGIKFALQSHDIRFSTKDIKEHKDHDPYTFIKKIKLFDTLTDESKIIISKQMKLCHYSSGALIVKQGELKDSLLIIAEGVISVRIKFDEVSDSSYGIEIARKSVKEIIGEMALITGKPRSCSIISLTESTLFEISKHDMIPLIHSHPEIAEKLNTIIYRREIKTGIKKKEHTPQKQEPLSNYSQLIEKIKSFFDMIF